MSRNPEEGLGAGSLLFLPFNCSHPAGGSGVEAAGPAQGCWDAVTRPGRELPAASSSSRQSPHCRSNPASRSQCGAWGLAAPLTTPGLTTNKHQQPGFPHRETVCPQQPPALPRDLITASLCVSKGHSLGKPGLCLLPWGAAPGTFLGTEAQSPMATLLLESPEEPWADVRAQHVLANSCQEPFPGGDWDVATLRKGKQSWPGMRVFRAAFSPPAQPQPGKVIPPSRSTQRGWEPPSHWCRLALPSELPPQHHVQAPHKAHSQSLLHV